MNSKMFYGCAVYVSEARRASVVQELTALLQSMPGVCLANTFPDKPYNRTSWTLVAQSLPCLASAVVHLAQTALQQLDLRQHGATHPRLGIVDHVSCHPLTPSSGDPQQTATDAKQQQEQAVLLAVSIARQLGCGPLAVPVFTYGWAHPQRRPLDELRRQLGYFRGAAAGRWQGNALPASSGATSVDEQLAAEQPPLPAPPCFGPAVCSMKSGVCCVGAGTWVVNYNVLLSTHDMAAARWLARGVSERGGGLPGVQAMALRQEGGIEVACNLLQPDLAPPEVLLATLQRLASERGVAVAAAYATNKSPQELVATAVAQGL